MGVKQKNSGQLPELFLERLADIAGSSLFSDIRKTFVERPTTFRVNTMRTGKLRNKEMKKLLEENGFKVKQVSWYPDAFILLNKSKRELMETDAYKNGEIYVQSLASMAPPLALDPKPGEKVLDLTAAPGSKTSQIAAMMNREGELVANDNNKIRFFKLKANMEMLGVIKNIPSPGRGACLSGRQGWGRGLNEGDIDVNGLGWTFTLRMEHGVALCREYGEPYFDKILLDAPCSAEARFIEGDARTYGYWSERKIKEMAYKQRQLLLSAWPILKPGGVLVYSTCTFAPEENEMQISRLLERCPDAETEDIAIDGIRRMPIATEWRGNIMHPGVAKCFWILPTRDIEGFFIAKVRKKLLTII